MPAPTGVLDGPMPWVAVLWHMVAPHLPGVHDRYPTAWAHYVEERDRYGHNSQVPSPHEVRRRIAVLHWLTWHGHTSAFINSVMVEDCPAPWVVAKLRHLGLATPQIECILAPVLEGWRFNRPNRGKPNSELPQAGGREYVRPDLMLPRDIPVYCTPPSTV